MKLTVPDSSRQPIIISFMLTVLIILITSIYLIIAQPELPLFYTLASPTLQIAPKIWLTLIPALSAIVHLFHLALLKEINQYDEILTSLFAWTGVIMHALLLVALLRIVLITI